MCKFNAVLFIVNCLFVNNALGSLGDRSQFYTQCIPECYSASCKHNVQYEIRVSPIDNALLTWTCEDECSYKCMWETAEAFTKHGYQVPQFHGKWPFIRILGLQEPASVFFSILNFYAHVTMYRKFRRETRADSPMSLVWTYFTVVCLNGWFWSSIFHARDRPFTEMMDYSCAFAIVLTLLYSMLVRIAYRNKKALAVITCAYISILFAHLSHLWSGKINYGYNMKINILFGFLTFVITMIWWYLNSRKLSHAYLIGWFNVLTVSVTLLEVADFPPFFWIFDAHALWHASTAPLTIILYKFNLLRFSAASGFTVCVLVMKSLMEDLPQRSLPFNVWLPFENSKSLLGYCIAYSHQMLGICISCGIGVAFDTFVPALMLQICAQLNILKHRFVEMPQLILNMTHNFQNGEHFHLCTVNAESKLLSLRVQHHLQIFKLAEKLNDLFGLMIFLQYTLSTLIICACMLDASQMKIFSSLFAVLFIYIAEMSVQILMYCFYGGEVTIESLNLCDGIYEMDWTVLSVNSKRSLLTIMARTTRPITFTSGHILTMNLESFKSLLKLSYSTFNVLQTQT